MKNIGIKTNKVFKHLQESTKRFIVEQGGTRSGKTYNIVIWLIVQAIMRKGIVVAIVRKTYPSLRATVLRDFIEIMETMLLYDERRHNKSEGTYTFKNGSMIEFLSVDKPQKIRGRKRHICFINEANELTYEDFFQLNIRTTERMVLDYNPSEEFWIYDELIPRDDCEFHITTYKDNPFLTDELIREIERLKETDEYYWTVYGLGEKAIIKGVVFTNWEIKSFEFEDESHDDYKTLSGYGMDFGFTNDPTTLIAVHKQNGELWVRSLIWERGMTNPDIANRMEELEVVNHDIVADSAEPKSIEELRRLGWNVRPSKKGAGSIREGIGILKQQKINVHPNSPELIKEFKSYKFKKDRDGKYLNEPVDKFNHGIDAIRYKQFTDGDGYGQYVVL